MKTMIMPAFFALLGFTLSEGLQAKSFDDDKKDAATTAEFEKPVRVQLDGKPIQVEAPGYACPAWADMDGDGTKDLLVGQFAGGKIMVYKHDGDLQFAEGEWLKAGDKVAEVPGVW